MQWHYANSGERQGPVSEADFVLLAQQGVIKNDTLVWREGMEKWQPFSAVAASVLPADPAAGLEDETTAVCVVSGRRYPKREMLQYEGKWISAERRDEFYQRLREGVAQPSQGLIPGLFGYGGFWMRFLAVMVDGIIMWVVNLLPSMIIRYLLLGTILAVPQAETFSPAGLKVLGLSMVISLALTLTYEVWFIRRFDATPGKMALGLKLLRADGQKLGVGRIIGRNLAKAISGIILCIGYLMAGFDDEKRTLHDRICDTRVIRTR